MSPLNLSATQTETTMVPTAIEAIIKLIARVKVTGPPKSTGTAIASTLSEYGFVACTVAATQDRKLAHFAAAVTAGRLAEVTAVIQQIAAEDDP
jgi:hypothetical protein